MQTFIDLIQCVAIFALAVTVIVQSRTIYRLHQRLSDDNLMVVQVRPGTVAVTTEDGFKLAEIRPPKGVDI